MSSNCFALIIIHQFWFQGFQFPRKKKLHSYFCVQHKLYKRKLESILCVWSMHTLFCSWNFGKKWFMFSTTLQRPCASLKLHVYKYNFRSIIPNYNRLKFHGKPSLFTFALQLSYNFDLIFVNTSWFSQIRPAFTVFVMFISNNFPDLNLLSFLFLTLFHKMRTHKYNFTASYVLIFLLEIDF